MDAPRPPRAAEQGRPRRSFSGYLLMLPGTAWLGIFFAVPLVTLLSTSLYDPSGSLETGYAMTFAWSNYTDAWSTYGDAFLRSMLYAGTATVLCMILGFPLAYAIAFKAGRWKNLMLVAVIAPFFTSFLVRTLSWQLILADNGAVASMLRAVGLLGADGRLLATPVAVIAGLTYNFLPFMVLPLYAALERLDGRLLEAGADLYASPFTVFRKVTLPLAMPGLIAGTLLTFIPAAGDYVNDQLLGNPETRMIGNVIQSLFNGSSFPAAAALSVTLMAVIVAMVMVYIRRAGTEDLV